MALYRDHKVSVRPRDGGFVFSLILPIGLVRHLDVIYPTADLAAEAARRFVDDLLEVVAQLEAPAPSQKPRDVS